MHGQPKPELTPEEKLKNLETDLTKLSKDIQKTIGHSYESKDRVKPRYLNKYEEQETARKLKKIRDGALDDLDAKFSEANEAVLNNVKTVYNDLNAKLSSQFSNFIELGDDYKFQDRVDSVNAAQQQLEAKMNELIKAHDQKMKDEKDKIQVNFESNPDVLAARGEIAIANEKLLRDHEYQEGLDKREEALAVKEGRVILLKSKIQNPSTESKESARALQQLNVASAEEHAARVALDNFKKPYNAKLDAANARLKQLESKRDSELAATDRDQTKYKEKVEEFTKAKKEDLEYFKKTDEFQKEVDKLKQSVADQYHLAYVRSHRKDTGDEWIPVKGDAKAAYDAAHGKEAIALGADPKELISKPGTYYHKDGRWSWHIVLDDKGFVTTAPVLTENDNREENYKARIHFIAKQAGAKSMFIQYKKVSGYIDVGMLEFLCKEAWSHGMTISNFGEIMNEVDKADPPIPVDKHRAIKILQDKNEEEEKAQAGKDQALENAGKTFREEAKLHNAIESLESNKANRIAENKNSELENEDIEELKSAPPEPPDDAKVIDYGKLYVYKSSDEKRAGIEFCYKTLSGEVKKIRPEDLNDDLKLNDQKFPLSDENREIIINSKFFKDLSETKKGDSYLTSIEAKATKSMDKLKNYEAEVDKLTAQAARLEKGINVLDDQVRGVRDEMNKIAEGKSPYDEEKKANEDLSSLRNKYKKLHKEWMDLTRENQKELDDFLGKHKILGSKLKELSQSVDEKENKGSEPFVGDDKERPKFKSKLDKLQNKLKNISVTIKDEKRNVDKSVNLAEIEPGLLTRISSGVRYANIERPAADGGAFAFKGMSNFEDSCAELENAIEARRLRAAQAKPGNPNP